MAVPEPSGSETLVGWGDPVADNQVRQGERKRVEMGLWESWIDDLDRMARLKIARLAKSNMVSESHSHKLQRASKVKLPEKSISHHVPCRFRQFPPQLNPEITRSQIIYLRSGRCRSRNSHNTRPVPFTECVDKWRKQHQIFNGHRKKQNMNVHA